MIILLDCGSNKTTAIAEIIKLKHPYKSVQFDTCTKKDFEEADGLIIGGSPELLEDRNVDEELKRTAFLKDLTIPILGICFGHQWLAVLYGAKYWTKAPVRTAQEIITLGESMLIAGFPPTFKMEQDHTEYVGLPDGFQQLATSTTCYNEAMQHTQKPIWGVQFHPETSGMLGAQLIHNFLGYCAYYKPTS